MIDPLRDGLIDQSSYVRRAAVLSCAKLFRLDRSIGKGMLAYCLLDLLHYFYDFFFFNLSFFRIIYVFISRDCCVAQE
jgi:hypothetical protein